jgi:hypothetical protein
MTAMTDDNRDKVIALDRERRNLRTHLIGDAEQAKHDLHPRTLIERWKGRKRQQLTSAAKTGKQSLTRNAPLIGLAGAAILIFAARKPIFVFYHQLRNKKRQVKDRTS